MVYTIYFNIEIDRIVHKIQASKAVYMNKLNNNRMRMSINSKCPINYNRTVELKKIKNQNKTRNVLV